MSDTEWQPAKTMPGSLEGELLAWNDGFREVVQVRRFDKTRVVNTSKGRLFTPRWWRPLLPPPPDLLSEMREESGT